MTGFQIREKLHAGECVYGTQVVGLMNPVAHGYATQIKLDFAFFCTEHMPLDRTEVSLLCQLYAAQGISPIVRVPSPDATSITMMLDGGAEGIVVPYVETVAQVKVAAGAVKYRPLKGELLRDVLLNGAELTPKTRHFLKEFNRNNYLIIGIESVAAIENLENLITAAEIDGVFLGPHDITTSMGIPEEYDNPLFLNTMEDIMRRCREHSIGVGMHALLLELEPETLRRFFRAGMNWVINSNDVTVMRDAMNSQLQTLRQIEQENKNHSLYQTVPMAAAPLS